MTGQAFSLIAFPAPSVPDITITGQISLQDHLLTLHYALAGKIEAVFLPPPASQPSRRDELWQTTCFEFFLAVKDQPQYWEFNLSPSGDWNVYRMDAYRRAGFREEASIQRLQFGVQRLPSLDFQSQETLDSALNMGSPQEPGAFTLNAAVDLNPVFQGAEPLEIGITAVIHTQDGNETYWALTHPAPYADFHLRESFILTPAGQNQPLGQSAPGD